MRLLPLFMLSLFTLLFSPSALALSAIDLPAEEARAKNGNVASQALLGDYNYARGRYTQALKWYRLAARQGQYDARGRIARMYEMGEGVAKDLFKAYILTRKIQEEYPNRYPESLEAGERKVKELARQLTPEQVEEAEKLIQKDWDF